MRRNWSLLHPVGIQVADCLESRNKPPIPAADAKKFDSRLVWVKDLGYGSFGRVEKVMHGAVCLARKRIVRKRGGLSVEEMRQEGLTMRKLDHRHVVKLVATYSPRNHELCLLIWPAAVCDLRLFLDDLEDLRIGDGDRDDIMGRLDALDLKDLSAIEPPLTSQNFLSDEKCPVEFLRTVIGCVARAMAHCHANGVRHLDIKPSNILLKRDRVYLADFGISRDVSGQDQTTTDGLPGTERWRAPELYGDHGSSMQLSDIYSLGLVYLNIATALYNVRLGEFNATLDYSSTAFRGEQLKIREEKIKMHLEKLTRHALVTPPFMFTYEGQETVRPRPLVNLISHMVATSPRNRPQADKVDEKLSMLGGIHQIYHAECCKRPMSWVEDRWDRKFTTISNLKKENDQLHKKIDELRGRDETYETRLQNERRAHEHDIARLQALLKEADEKCQRLEVEKATRKKNHHGHDAPRPTMPGAKRSSVTASTASVGLGLTKIRSTPTKPAARPAMQPASRSTQQVPSCTPPWASRKASVGAPQTQSPLNSHTTRSPAQRSPSVTNLSGYQLRSRGSGSKLPLPVTPGSRSSTPVLNRDQSLTDSSMASSVFSRHSIETVPTPSNNSPQLQRTPMSGDVRPEKQWTELPARPSSPSARRTSVATQGRPSTPSTPSAPASPVLSMTASVMSSPRTLKSDLASEASDANSTARPPSLQPMKSWADVAKLERRRKVAQRG